MYTGSQVGQLHSHFLTVIKDGFLPGAQPLVTSSGIHVLKIYMVDPYVTINKFVIYTEEQKTSNLGPIVRLHSNSQ
jgi:hypothetical protein